MSKKIINNLFHYAAKENAAGLVIENNLKEISFSYSMPDGGQQNFGLPKKLETNLMNNLRQILKIASDELANQKYCKIYDKNYCLTFYLTILPTDSGEKVIINIIKKNNRLWKIKQLGLQRNQLKTLKEALRTKSGLIVISGSAGGGKSTTLYSLLQELNQPESSIYLLEKQPEYEIDGINQLSPTKTNWEKILQYDSDIIALDDLESDEDFKRLFQAANSGRLVLTTITADSSWGVLLKILKLKLPLNLKLNTLKLIINQGTVRLKRAKKQTKSNRQEIGLFEILSLSPKMKKFISDSQGDPKKEKFWEKLARLALANGFQTISEDLKKKIKDGLLDPKDYS